MRLVRSASEDEVIAAFLRAEIDSDRFGQGILAALEADHRPRSIVDSAILRDPEESMYRRSLLGRVRGWGRGEGMFQGFPAEIEWNLAAVTPKELAQVRYIAWDWWLDRSAGTRLATEYARRIRAGDFPGDPDSGLRYHEAVARRLREGPPLPLLIVVSERSRPDFLVLVEGHVRLTAFFLYPEMLPEEMELYLGTAIGLDRWGLY
jgi:hypothetical protein